jgi:hypothetical protein
MGRMDECKRVSVWTIKSVVGVTRIRYLRSIREAPDSLRESSIAAKAIGAQSWQKRRKPAMRSWV